MENLNNSKKWYVAVIGGGAVGTALGAMLGQNENITLTIVEKNPIRRIQLGQYGLQYQLKDCIVTVPSNKFKIVESLSENQDYIFISTKSYQFSPPEYKEQIAKFISNNTKVILTHNGYPSLKMLTTIGEEHAVIMVFNTGVALEKEGSKTITNKSISDFTLPFGSIDGKISSDNLDKIKSLFIGKYSSQIVSDINIKKEILEKNLYLCTVILGAVIGFLNGTKKFATIPVSQLLDAAKLDSPAESPSPIKIILQKIVAEIHQIGLLLNITKLLSFDDIMQRLKTNSTMQNTLVGDLNNGKQAELNIIDNICSLSKEISAETPILNHLSQALHIIENDKWELRAANIEKVSKIFQAMLDSNFLL